MEIFCYLFVNNLECYSYPQFNFSLYLNHNLYADQYLNRLEYLIFSILKEFLICWMNTTNLSTVSNEYQMIEINVEVLAGFEWSYTYLSHYLFLIAVFSLTYCTSCRPYIYLLCYQFFTQACTQSDFLFLISVMNVIIVLRLPHLSW